MSRRLPPREQASELRVVRRRDAVGAHIVRQAPGQEDAAEAQRMRTQLRLGVPAAPRNTCEECFELPVSARLQSALYHTLSPRLRDQLSARLSAPNNTARPADPPQPLAEETRDAEEPEP